MTEQYEPTLPSEFGASMPHPSRPGYYGLELDAAAGEALHRVADVMIPEGDGYPAAGEFAVPFTSSRVSPEELEIIEPVLESLGREDSAAGLERSLRELESAKPDAFGLIMAFVYFSYYTAPAVHRAMRERGSDYHGAPQPLGYEIERDPPVPMTPRGSYVPTEEVRRVTV